MLKIVCWKKVLYSFQKKNLWPETSETATHCICFYQKDMIVPLFNVTSMIMRSLGPGPLRESPSSKLVGTGVPPLAFEFGELDLLSRVGVGQGVRLGLLRRVLTVRVTTPFFSCWKGGKSHPLMLDGKSRNPRNFLFPMTVKMIQRNGPEMNSLEIIFLWGFMHCYRCFWGWLSSLPWRSEWPAGAWGLGETLHWPPISHHLKSGERNVTSNKNEKRKSSCHNHMAPELHLLWWQLFQVH